METRGFRVEVAQRCGKTVQVIPSLHLRRRLRERQASKRVESSESRDGSRRLTREIAHLLLGRRCTFPGGDTAVCPLVQSPWRPQNGYAARCCHLMVESIDVKQTSRGTAARV